MVHYVNDNEKQRQKSTETVDRALEIEHLIIGTCLQNGLQISVNCTGHPT